MKRLVLLVLAGCSSEAQIDVSLAPRYDAAAVLRILPDGQFASSLAVARFSLDQLSEIRGSVQGNAAGAIGVAAIEGTLDEDDNLLFAPFDASLTSSVAERVEGLGGILLDGFPKDSLGDEINGFVQTRVDRLVRSGSFLAISERTGRPRTPSRLTANVTDLGRIRIRGAAGSADPRAGIEVFIHGLRPEPPEYALGRADDSGAFELDVPGFENDVVLVRARIGGVASDAEATAVMP